MTNDVEALDSLVTDSVVTLFQGGLTLIGTLVILIYLDLAPGADHVRDGAGDRGRLADLPRSSRRTPTGARARRSARSPPTCRSRCRACASCARSARSRATPRSSRRSTSATATANMRTVNLNAAYFPAIEFVSAVATVVVLLYGGSQVLDGTAQAGRARRLPRGAQQLLQPDHAALAALHDLPGGDGGARQDLRAARRAAGDGRARPTRVDARTVRGELLFDHVSFAYPPARRRRRAARARRRRPADRARRDGRAGRRDRRRQVDVRQARRALLRPDARARADRRPRPARRDAARSLRSQLGVVPQEAFLFSGTMRSNIAFGRPGRERRGDRGGGARDRRARLHRRRSSTATTPRSASAAASSRPGSASSSRSRAR